MVHALVELRREIEGLTGLRCEVAASGEDMRLTVRDGDAAFVVAMTMSELDCRAHRERGLHLVAKDLALLTLKRALEARKRPPESALEPQRPRVVCDSGWH